MIARDPMDHKIGTISHSPSMVYGWTRNLFQGRLVLKATSGAQRQLLVHHLRTDALAHERKGLCCLVALVEAWGQGWSPMIDPPGGPNVELGSLTSCPECSRFSELLSTSLSVHVWHPR